MKYITGDIDLNNFKSKNTAITLGKFDGLHLGHQLLINKVKAFKDSGYNALMFTFNMNPISLDSDKNIKLLFTEDEKIRLANKFGMDYFISYPFTDIIKNMSAEDFITEILVKQLDAKVIVVGSDYRFGYKRTGDIKLLKELGNKLGFEIVVFDKLKIDNTIVSSTKIRESLAIGDIEKVNKFLGRPYSIYGKVEHGNRIGRTIGAPTINIRPDKNKAVPIIGVYVSKTNIDNIEYQSITSIGYKPTVTDGKTLWVETFIFDYDNDLYGRFVEVKLYKLLREEKKFSSIEELKEQMSIDIKKSKNYFNKREQYYVKS
ncbi:MAG TPA: bifunctional riboflavin kinase/FAD synthetase [Clostridiales bacterium]|nr:bifunctional riboflavin kinase/FAD synthetase [Clostridiales bacterium]